MLSLLLTLTVCILLVSVILVQNAKGILQSAAATQMIGVARSKKFIEKTTWGLALAFALVCLY